MRVKRLFLLLGIHSLCGLALGQEPQIPQPDVGIPVTDQTTKTACSSCHKIDDKGRMTRISYIRTTPEGWQEMVKRMVRSHGVQLDPAQARAIVKYLSNNHGLAPEEARAGFYEAERRVVRERIPDESLVRSCRPCHSLGRVLSQHRTREDWQLLANMHMAVFPLSEGQGNFAAVPPPEQTPVIRPAIEDLTRMIDSPRPGPIYAPPPEMVAAGAGGGRGGGAGGGGPDGGGRGGAASGGDPLDQVLTYLARNQGLDTPEWTAWRANFRQPRLDGTWLVQVYLPGKGRGFGQMSIERERAEDEYRTRTTLDFQDGEKTMRTGRVILYAGYSWRGSSSDAQARTSQIKDLKEVMMLSSDLESMRGRWFSGAYDEFGMDVVLRKTGRDIIVSATDQPKLMTGRTATVKIYGANFPNDLKATDIDFGPGTTVSNIRPTASIVTADVAVDAKAVAGYRDLVVRGKVARRALALFDRIDYIRILPEQGMARLGGVVFPKQFQQFDAVAYHNGADKVPNTADDIELGPVPVKWSMEEFAVTIGDDDIRYVGTIDAARGLFTPNIEGPNPERKNSTNNYGDVRVVGVYTGEGAAKPLRATSHLIVTVPLYVRWAQQETFRDR